MQHTDSRRPCAGCRYACRMSHRLARIVSILRHPLVPLPVAALLLTANQGAGPARLSALVLGLGAIALGVIGYWRWPVRRQQIGRGSWWEGGGHEGETLEVTGNIKKKKKSNIT